MPDVFIAYNSTDEQLARFLYSHLAVEGLVCFLAPISIYPGDLWQNTIKMNLKASACVVILCSKAAIRSAFVQQEIGGAWLIGKKIIPIVWDISARELPGYLGQHQALDLNR